MKNLKLIFVKVMTFVLTIFMSGCNEPTEEFVESTTNTEHDIISETVLNNLSKLGFNIKDHKVIKIEEGYLVEEDIVVPFEEVENAISSTEKHRRVGSKIKCRKFKNIKVSTSFKGNNRKLVSRAVKSWNKVTGNMKLTLIKKGKGDIHISFDNKVATGLGEFPSKGKPGKRIKINNTKNYWKLKNITDNFKVDVLTHELGHTLGLGHTNTNYGSNISGTSKRDKFSIMNKTTWNLNGKEAKLTDADKKALRKLVNRCQK